MLTDDLSLDLISHMPVVQAMQRRGLTFRNYFVSDSLCCPSRASIFTGNLPHDTHVFSNVGRQGGFNVFHRRGEERNTFAVKLHNAGYQTAMMGKYLNGYLQSTRKGSGDVPQSFVPPGWSDWDVAGWGYPEYGYLLNDDRRVTYYGDRASDYLTDVLAEKGSNFIDHASATGRPFFLELATFAPHAPYVPPRRYAHLFPGLSAPKPPNFDAVPKHAPPWLAQRPPLTRRQIVRINRVFRLRVQDVQGVDDLLTSIEAALTARGVANNTYVVFSSDNGLHTGEYRLMPGKMTAYDTDIHVPLIVTGPGVPQGASTADFAENIDLAKTFEAIAGLNGSNDGHSLLPLLRGLAPKDWRNAILIEHRGPKLTRQDPDYQSRRSGNPPSYEAIRSSDYLYVDYTNSRQREFYDLRTDPFELDNVFTQLTPQARQQLQQELTAMERCHTGASCWTAMHVKPTPDRRLATNR